MRRIFIVLSPRSLSYSQKCIASLFKNALEQFDLKLITDSPEDKQMIDEVVSKIENPQSHLWKVIDQAEADAQADEQFKGFENLKTFRFGHPCWRKVTDPLLFTNDGEEMIILDPDVYFPNKFTFEPTPEKTLLLMWQPPNCLCPPEYVYAAINAPVKLAHHVDIGVAQLRPPIDLEWMDWFVGRLGGKNISKKYMHVEAIAWSALAMKMGGSYLNPQRWVCFRHSHWKRIFLKAGVSGVRILQMENLASAKCFHAGGIAKWWLVDAAERGLIESKNELNQPSPTMPFVELTPQRYDWEQRIKGVLHGLGYYSLINPD